MTFDTVASRLSVRFTDLISRTAQFLCREGRFGTWGTTRTSGTAIWALAECGLTHSHKDFLLYCIRQLLSSEDFLRDENGSRFNDEVWDTSVGLMAIVKATPGEFSGDVEQILHWLRSQAQDDNFKNEPWETFWALNAFLESGMAHEESSSFLQLCMEWVLRRRNTEGVLISSHYMGFLLTILNLMLQRINLRDTEVTTYTQTAEFCEIYLKEEFTRTQVSGKAWGNEPWIVGHILLGIATSPDNGQRFFTDVEFNEGLLRWYDQLDWDPAGGGWRDLVETSFTLVGLARYHWARERRLRGPGSTISASEIASKIEFKFDERALHRMRVYPVWRTRKFTVAKNMCFILMPFEQPWSNRIYRIIGNIVRDSGMIAKRADEIYGSNPVMEDIWASLNEAAIVIAECTGRNPNVFYELGIAHTVGKKVIIVTQNENDIPFDVRNFRYIKYEDNDDGYQKLRAELPRHIAAIQQGG
jgi:hypothetical protein